MQSQMMTCVNFHVSCHALQVAYANADRREALCEQYFALWTPSVQPGPDAPEQQQSLQDRRETIAQQTQDRHV